MQFPVAMLGEYLALETAYLERGLGGAPLTVRASGLVEDRPAMDGDGEEAVCVVSSFEILDEDIECPVLQLREDLAGREWELEWVWGDVEGVGTPGGDDPTLLWNPEEVQLSGNSGCNRFTGRGVLRGSLLVSGTMVSTRMFCEGAMEREARVLSLFSNDLVVRIEGEELTLYRRGEVAAVYRGAESSD
jgi:heat shock protein HslJ